MRTLLITLSLCIASIAYGQSGVKDKKLKGQAAQDQRGTKKQPLVIEGYPPTKPETETKEEREYRAKQSEIGAGVHDALRGIVEESHSTTYLTAGLFAVAIFQAFMFAVQLCMMQRSLKDARIAAIAARQSANATKSTVKLMRDTSQKDLRAYVALFHLAFPSEGRGDSWSYFKIRPQNYGRTPAHDMSIWYEIVETKPTKYEYTSAKVPEQMLHPTQGYGHQVHLPDSRESDTFKGWYVYGRFVYRDIYEDWWVTKFCYLFEGEDRFLPHGPYNREEGPYSAKEDALAA